MPVDKCTCGFVSAAAAPAKSACQWRWEFFKKNLPAIISICSVVLNVVIISRLIPDMQANISVMQGQAQSVQTQVNSINGLLFGVNDKINDANNKIDSFNVLVHSVTQTLNATQSNIAAFSEQTQLDLVVMRATAADTLAGFANSTTLIERQLNASQTSADATLVRVEAASAALDVKATQYASAADASLLHLLATNTSVLLGVESVRADFTDRIVPAVTADLQSLNMSSAIAAQGLAIAAVGTTWRNYEPDVSGTLGGESVIYDFQQARFLQIGKSVLYTFSIRGRVSSSAAGSFVCFSIPVGGSFTRYWIGQFSYVQLGDVVRAVGTTVPFMFRDSDGALGIPSNYVYLDTNAGPLYIADGDFEFRGQIQYVLD